MALTTSEKQKASDLSRQVAALLPSKKISVKKATPSPLKLKYNYSALKPSYNLSDIPKTDSAQDLAKKLNTLVEAIDARVIKGLPTVAGLVNEIKSRKLLENKGRFDMSDQRWHGGGISTVSHDGTLTGTGTASSPLSVVSSAATFVDNEVVAGAGTSWTLAGTPIVGSAHLYGGGIRLTPTVDYSITGAVITTINSYSTGQILADYRT